MKLILYLSCVVLIYSCSTQKGVYWCGDHPCINKKERESYFKNNMIVEFKELKKKDLKKDSEVERIMSQAKQKQKNEIKEEKILAKKSKLDEKNRIKKEKALLKKARLDEKNRINDEKALAKKVENDEKNIIKKKKEVFAEDKIVENANLDITESNVSLSEFEKEVRSVKQRNSKKPYPDINRAGN